MVVVRFVSLIFGIVVNQHIYRGLQFLTFRVYLRNLKFYIANLGYYYIIF